MSGRGKRSFDPMSTQEEGQRESKRPALASVIVEALKVDSLQKLCSSLEPILRRVVSEEVERALAKLGPARSDGRVSPGRIEGPDGRNLQIQFKSKLSLPLFTGGKVEGEQGSAIHVVLFDRNAGQVVTSGPESSVRLNVVVLEGDFNKEDEESWSQEEFESHIVVEREGRRPLLTGDLQVALKEGVGTLGDLTFTDNSSWVRSRKFRLGLKVASGNFRILEASTEAFSVRDHRGELYKKHYPPSPNDEVWRLEKIGKDGSFHKRLNEAGIYTVQDFLRLVILNHQELRRILGTGMSNKMWDSLVEHSKTCVLSGKHYVYYPDEAKNVGVVFNNRYELSGLIAGGEYRSIDSLSENQKVCVDSFVKNAYENWGQVIEYDSESLMGFHQDKALDSSQNALPDPISAEISHTNQRSTIEGYDADIPMQLNMNIDANLASPSFSQHNQHFHSVQPSLPFGNENLLSLGPSIPTMPNFPTSTISNLNSYRGFEDTLADEIRVRSHEMLEGEDMQHLLRMYSIGRHGYPSFDATENSYAYSGYAPFSPSNFMLEEDRTRPTGKAVVGWLKLKAALRWGIFIRKQAAERRAQIVDLEDL